MVKRSLFIYAMALVVIAFITLFAPPSSHVYTIEEVKPYQMATSWAEERSSLSYATVTSTISKSWFVFRDDPDGSLLSRQDVEQLVLEREEGLLHVYLSLSHGKVNLYRWTYQVTFDLNGDKLGDYIIWFDGGFDRPTCQLWRYKDGKAGEVVSSLQCDIVDSNTLYTAIPPQKIGNARAFYVWASVGYWEKEHGYPMKFTRLEIR